MAARRTAKADADADRRQQPASEREAAARMRERAEKTRQIFERQFGKLRTTFQMMLSP